MDKYKLTDTTKVVHGNARVDENARVYGNTRVDGNLQARIAELKAEIQELRKATEWQPIETAPGFGIPIRLWLSCGEAVGYYRDGCFYVSNRGLGPDYKCDGEDYYDPPTHWQPLAPFPNENQTNDRI